MLAPQHVFGPVAILGNTLPALAPNAIVVVASSVRHIPEVTRALAAWETHVFTGARVHVPIEVVEAAEATLATTQANVIVAVGGGSSIGLGKALKLRAAEAGHALRFVAIPTTYAGSENTSIYGITRGRDKQTGRDERVRPDVIISDVELTLELPIAMTAQSLCNAIAHVASALSTTTYAGIELHAHHGADLEAVATAVSAIEALAHDPRDRGARIDALIASSTCARCLDAGKAGVQHAFAHLLGGAFGVDHAPLHSILLPRFLAANDRVRDALERDGTGHTRWTVPIDTYLVDLLHRVGAPTTLGALGITREALDEVLATRLELPGDIARAAL
ncbi:MAG: iron-containing alcohol dehydrogenase [Kofleriaceae bacterium]